jgi:hypothetical protein
MTGNGEIDLDKLDQQLLADLEQQVRDGLITQAEADRLAEMIRKGESRRRPRERP